MTIHLNDAILYQLLLGSKLEQKNMIDKGYVIITELDKKIFLNKLSNYLKKINKDVVLLKPQSTSLFKVFPTSKQGKNYLFIERATILLRMELLKYFNEEEVEKIISTFVGSSYVLENEKIMIKK